MVSTAKNCQNQLPISSNRLIELLEAHNIEYKLFNHEPLFSVSESKSYQDIIFPNDINSVHIKNLYLRDKKKQNFLITCEQDKNIALKKIKEVIECERLSFGSEERLFEFLGVLPGSVSPFCMLNGSRKNVKFICDYGLKKFKKIFLHPFVNDKTIYLKLNDLEKFLRNHDIQINWIKL